MKVTRTFQSKDLTQSKYDRLLEMAAHLGRVRTDLWNRYGALSGVGLSFIDIRDAWLKKQHVPSYIPARLWKATLRDVIGDISACRDAAKEKVRKCIHRKYPDTPKNEVIRKDLYSQLKWDRWTENTYLSRLMRKYWKRGHTSVKSQIILDMQSYRWFERDGCGWVAVQSFEKGNRIAIPLSSHHPVTGTLRLILREGKVEIHHLVEMTDDKSCGDATLGIDKGYTEAFTDSDGDVHGDGLGKEISRNSNDLKSIYQHRNKLKALAEKYEKTNPEKAANIREQNLGRKKLDKKQKKHRIKIRNIVFKAAHSVVDKANIIVVEDLTKPIKRKEKKKAARKNYGKNQRRRLSAWVKGTLADALDNVSLRRGASVVPINAAYTSQVHHICGCFGDRNGDVLHCNHCKVDIDSDWNAAENVLARLNDLEISLWTPYKTVKSILQTRIRQSAGTAQPGLELSSSEDHQPSANYLNS